MKTKIEQRWREGRPRWVREHQLFDPTQHEVHIISECAAKTFVKAHHYSGTYPAARFRVGLFRSSDLVGVAVFSVPASQKVFARYVDLCDPLEGVELGRLVLSDQCQFNAESWFVARAFSLVRRELGVRFVLSYSDPIGRTDSQGHVVKPGHIGQVYQALNAEYFGRASPSTLWLLPSGRVISPRSISKVRNAERGRQYALDQIIAGGAPAPNENETGAEYVARVSPLFRKMRHPGNLAYAWLFDRHLAPKLPTLPYLKLTH
jgi:hypothetical protein